MTTMADEDECTRLRAALVESIKLQSHYAQLLNQFDGGQRLQFAGVDDWMERCRAMRGWDR